jgi:hypothetical protein
VTKAFEKRMAFLREIHASHAKQRLPASCAVCALLKHIEKEAKRTDHVAAMLDAAFDLLERHGVAQSDVYTQVDLCRKAKVRAEKEKANK